MATDIEYSLMVANVYEFSRGIGNRIPPRLHWSRVHYIPAPAVPWGSLRESSSATVPMRSSSHIPMAEIVARAPNRVIDAGDAY